MFVVACMVRTTAIYLEKHRCEQAIRHINLAGGQIHYSSEYFNGDITNTRIPHPTKNGGIRVRTFRRNVDVDRPVHIFMQRRFKSGTNTCEIDDDLLISISDLQSLRSVTLAYGGTTRGVSITPAGIRRLSTLWNLESLELIYFPVTDQCLKSLSTLRRLEVLNLRGSSITDEGLTHLRHLKELQWLDLSDTNISNTGLCALKDLKNLRVLLIYDIDAILQSDVPELKAQLCRGVRVCAGSTWRGVYVGEGNFLLSKQNSDQ
jgi:hypothetical protein